MSEIRANTISDSAGTGPVTLTGQSAAKAWVDLDGTGTAEVQDSNNISSISDNGTGNYTSNFTNSFSSNAFAYAAGGNQTRTTADTSWGWFVEDRGRASSYFRSQCFNDGYNVYDLAVVNVIIHGDLA